MKPIAGEIQFLVDPDDGSVQVLFANRGQMETQIKVNTLDITPVDMRQIHDSLNVIEMDIEQRKQQRLGRYWYVVSVAVVRR